MLARLHLVLLFLACGSSESPPTRTAETQSAAALPQAVETPPVETPPGSESGLVSGRWNGYSAVESTLEVRVRATYRHTVTNEMAPDGHALPLRESNDEAVLAYLENAIELRMHETSFQTPRIGCEGPNEIINELALVAPPIPLGPVAVGDTFSFALNSQRGRLIDAMEITATIRSVEGTLVLDLRGGGTLRSAENSAVESLGASTIRAEVRLSSDGTLEAMEFEDHSETDVLVDGTQTAFGVVDMTYEIRRR